MKKLLSYLFNILIILLILFILIQFIDVLFPNQITKNLRFRPIIMISNSMAPYISMGDIIFINGSDLDEVKEGEIVAFKRNDKLIVHYLAKKKITDEGISFRTRQANADTSEKWDYWLINEKNYVGKVQYVIPKLGKFILFLKSMIGIISLSICAAMFLIYYLVFGRSYKNG